MIKDVCETRDYYCINLPVFCSNHAHLRSTTMAPNSSYSYLLSHICMNEPRELRIEPPIHGVNFFSAACMTFTLLFCGATSGTCLYSLSTKPLKHVLPPVTIMFPYRSLLMSTSVLPIDSTTMLWTPEKPSNSSFCWNIDSTMETLWLPIWSWVPSGSSIMVDLTA